MAAVAAATGSSSTRSPSGLQPLFSTLTYHPVLSTTGAAGNPGPVVSVEPRLAGLGRLCLSAGRRGACHVRGATMPATAEGERPAA